MKKKLFRLGLLAAAAGPATACDESSLTDVYYGPLVYEGFPESANGASLDPDDPKSIYRAFNLSPGFADGSAYEYLDLGEINVVVPSIYIPAISTGGKLVPVKGQHPIVDVLPDDAEYSQYLRIVHVEVPSDYAANSVKSLKSLRQNGFRFVETLEAMHCPVVNPDASWFTTEGAPLTVFFGTGDPIPNPYYDPDPMTMGDHRPVINEDDFAAGDVLLQPIWHKRLLGFCFPGMKTAVDAVQKQYTLVEVEDAGQTFAVLDDTQFALRVEQLEAATDPETGESFPWATLPVFAGGPESADYTSGRNIVGIITATGDQVTDSSQLMSLEGEPFGLVDNPLIRLVPPPPPEPVLEEGGAM